MLDDDPHHPLPDRLNLAIARRCFVECAGCYSFIGRREPDLDCVLASVERFVEFGVDKVTVSGGDPLTIRGLDRFLRGLREVGVVEVKLDTVGTPVALRRAAGSSRADGAVELEELIGAVDYLGIPLDAATNDAAQIFRSGRPQLFCETRALLDDVERLASEPMVIINTVAHADNLREIPELFDLLMTWRVVCQWNVFQYTPTDQSREDANIRFAVSDRAFAMLGDELCSRAARTSGAPLIEMRTSESRLGEYLLVNSDGDVWLPDAAGDTIRLGPLFGHEADVLARWARVAQLVRSSHAHPR